LEICPVDIVGRAIHSGASMYDLISAMFVLALSAVLLVARQQFVSGNPEVTAAASMARPHVAAKSSLSYVR
jgi:hypothetical protein